MKTANEKSFGALREIEALWRRLVRRGAPISLARSSVTDEEFGLLEYLIDRVIGHPGPVIEIGTLAGQNALRMAQCKSNHHIITVDSFTWNPWGLRPAEHRSLAYGQLSVPIENGKITLVDSDKDEFYRTYSGAPPALVFLDAVHSYRETRKDISWARRIGALTIAGHDYSRRHRGVIRAVEEAGGPGLRCGSLWAL